MNTIVEAKGLSKAYGPRPVVTALDLTVAAGEVVALVGENGAGKTTALGMLSGQIVPDAGHALVGGHDQITAPMAARRLLGTIGQDQLLPTHLTLVELAEFVCQVKRMPLEWTELQRLLGLTSLQDDADRLVGELSYGMQRKAAWVVALIARPAALLADEGLAGLDAASSEGIIAEIALRLDQGTAVLWTEHDLLPIADLLSRVVVLHHGRVAETRQGDEIRAMIAGGTMAATMRSWTTVAGQDEP